MTKTVKLTKVDDIKILFENLYSKYSFLCEIDNHLWDFANDDFEAFAINLLFYLKTLDNDFVHIFNEINKAMEDCKE